MKLWQAFVLVMVLLTGCNTEHKPSKEAQEFLDMLADDTHKWKYVEPAFPNNYMECKSVRIEFTSSLVVVYVDNQKTEFLSDNDKGLIRKAADERRKRQAVKAVQDINMRSIDDRLEKLRNEERKLKELREAAAKH